jgi:hypothetical protein
MGKTRRERLLMKNMVWRPAEILLNSYGFSRAGTKIEKLLYKVVGIEKLDFGYSLNTHPRSGDFTTMVDMGIPMVKKHAKRRKIWWVNDTNNEWCNVFFLFGPKHLIIEKLKAVIDSERAEVKKVKNIHMWLGEQPTVPMAKSIARTIINAFGVKELKIATGPHPVNTCHSITETKWNQGIIVWAGLKPKALFPDSDEKNMEISIKVNGKFADIDDQFNKGYPEVKLGFYPGPIRDYSYVPVGVTLRNMAEVELAVKILKKINFNKMKTQPSPSEIKKWFKGFTVDVPTRESFS